jgi:hypothetical protein
MREAKEEAARGRLAAPLIFSAMMVAAGTALAAQTRTVGAIAGTVADDQAAFVPGATVRLRDERAGTERETVTNDRGVFSFLDLQAGSYEVTVSLQGFQATVYRGVAVESARTTDVRVQLRLGRLDEMVEVIGAAPTLQMTSTTNGTTVTNADVQNLPLAGRNVLNFATLVSGSQVAGVEPRQSTYQGMPGATINISLDGINNNSTGFKSGGTSFFATVPLRLDAIEEINVATAGLGADAGAEGAMNIRFVTKRGTNAFHGGLFYQVVHERFNANSYFNNARGLPKPRDRRNEFGGSLGGPIVRDKLFFFANWEDARVPGIVASTRNVLSAEAQNGIFRYRGTDGVERTANLLTLAAANGYPGTVDPIVRSQLSRISSTEGNAAVTFFDLRRNLLSWNEPRKTWEHYPTTRLDYRMTTNLTVNGAVNIFDRDIQGNRQFPGDVPAQSVFQNTWIVGSTSLNWVLSPNVLMEARYGIQRNQDTYNIGDLPQQYDISGRLMRISYPDPQTPNTPFIDPLIRNQLQIDRRNALQQVYNNVTIVRGDHTLNAGGTFRWVYWYDADYRGGGVPQYDLGLGTGDPAAGIFGPATLPGIGQSDLNVAWALYSILTGRVSGISAQRGVDPESKQYLDQHQLVRNDKQRNGGLYVEDQWRPNPRLTFNYGLRWQASGPVFNATDIYTNPTEEQLLGPSTTLFAPGRLDGAPDPAIELRPRTYRTDWNNLAPNAGVAWTPGRKSGWLGALTGREQLVIRGGYSKSYFDEGLNTFINYAGQNPGLIQQLSLSPGQPGFVPGGLTLSSPAPALQVFPASFAPPFRQSDFTFNQIDFSTTRETLPTPSVHSWNIGVQREIAPNTVVEARYVGNRASRWHGYDLNEINTIENGFLDEFRSAQRNLQINQANGRTGFANNGLPGQVSLPIFEAAFGARGNQAALPDSQGFASGTFINMLNQGEAGRLANTLAGSSLYLCRMLGSAFAPCGRLGFNTPGTYPINFFQANPFAAGRSIFVMDADGSFTSYHGLQLELRRRYTRGFTLTTNYAFSRAEGNIFADDTSARRNYSTLRDRSIDDGPSPFDLRHALQAYGTWELPFGSERRWSSRNGILKRVIGGWSISGITRWQQGRTFRLVSNRWTLNQRTAGVVLNGITEKDLQKLISVRPGTSGSTVFFFDQRLIGPDGRASPQFLQSPTNAGDLGEYVFLRGPSTFLTDLALLKDIDFTGGVRMSIWIEALNALNNANFLVGQFPGPDVDINSTTFGQTNVAGAPRNVQIRVKVSF